MSKCTAIYVYQTATITITTAESGLLLARAGGPADYAILGNSTSTELTLNSATYRVLSNNGVTVTGPGDSYFIAQTAQDKETLPLSGTNVIVPLIGNQTTNNVIDFLNANRSIAL